MSYLDAVSKKMQKNKIVGQNASPHEGVSKELTNSLLAQKDRLRKGIAGEARGRMHSDPKNMLSASTEVSNKRKSRQRLDKIRTAVRAGTEGPSASVKNTNKKSPRYGQYYSIEAGKGGNYHVYKGGKKVFVRSRTGLSINKRKSINAKQFNPKKGLHNKEYLIDA